MAGQAPCLGAECSNYATSIANNADRADITQMCEAEYGGPIDGRCRAAVLTGFLGTVELTLSPIEQGGDQ